MSDMKKPLFDLDVPGMQVEVNSYKPGTGLAWPTLFPLKYTPKFDLKGIEGDDGIPVSADRIAFNAQSPLKTRKKVGSWSGKLEKISISWDRDEEAINDYRDLKAIAAANTEDKSTAQYLVDMVYDDVKHCNEGCDHKIEIDALRVASSGKKVYDAVIEGENATQDVINFNVPEENYSGVKKPWDDTTADGIQDIANRQKFIKAQGLKKPMYAFMEQKAFDQLLLQDKTLKRVATVVLNVTGLASSEVLSLETVNRYMGSKGYPKILILDSYAKVEKKDGSQDIIKPWNENVVTLSPATQLGWTYYKTVPMVDNTDALQVQGKFAKTTVYSELNPMREVTMAEAYVQVGLTNRRSLCFLNVANTEWNEGQGSEIEEG